MTSIRAIPSQVGSRAVLVEAGLKMAMAATAFAAVALAFRLSGAGLPIALLGCIFSFGLLELSRRRALAGAALHPLVGPVVCLAFGVGAAALGSHGGLLFLPGLFVLATISVLARPGYLLGCSLLMAAGFLAPVITGNPNWAAPGEAVVLVALPFGLQRLAGRLDARRDPSTGREEALVPALATLTPRQAEVTLSLAEGMLHTEIAEQMGVSVFQVRRLIRQAKERTGTRTTAELVAITFASTRVARERRSPTDAAG